jgi:hypothetical protein
VEVSEASSEWRVISIHSQSKGGRHAALESSGTHSTINNFYILVIVKLPAPVQPTLPVSAQVPLIVPPLAFPVSVSVFPEGDPDRIEKPKAPVTLPLKSPLSVKVPLSVSPLTKHGELLVKLKLLTVNVPLPLCVIVVVKAKICVPPVSVSEAVQFPLTFPLLLEPPPHPARVNPTANIAIAAASFVINEVFPSSVRTDENRRSGVN